MKRLLQPFLDGAPWFRARPWLLAVLLLLAPAAFLAARHWHHLSNADAPFELEGYQEILTRAHATARALGIDTKGWRADFRVARDHELNQYLHERRRDLPSKVAATIPVTFTSVLLHSPGFENWIEFRYSQTGKLLRLEGTGLRGSNATISEAEARAIAQQAAESAFDPEHFELGEAVYRTSEAGSERVRGYEWKARARCCPELVADTSVRVDAGRVSFFYAASYLDQTYRARYRGRSGTFLDTMSWLFVFAATLFVSFRFARRMAEGEVPRRRILVIFSLFVVFAILVLLLAPFAMHPHESVWNLVTGIRPLFYAITLVFILAGGIVTALAYGAGEGDLREWFPGRLTSLDALLSGRLLSSNTGAAVALGAAWGAWGHALSQWLRWTFNPGYMPLPGAEIQWSFNAVPWLLVMLNILLDAALAVGSGLLVPAVFAFRSSAIPRKRFAVLAIAALWAFSFKANVAEPGTLALALVGAATVWLCFLTTDFLAAIVSQMVLQIGASLANAQAIMPAWSEPALIARMIVSSTILAAVVSAYRGRRYTDHEVRPQYAETIEQRLVLEAEVAAAGQAQQRLLPEGAPRIPGLDAAAFCAPAKTVSGDFYDFFTVPRGRLGLLVADGRTGGLSAALTIALAKGFLHYAAQRDWAPAMAVAELKRVMEGEELNLVYAVIDPTRGAMRFARTGATPRLLVGRDAGDSAEELAAAEGTASLSVGDVLVVYTDAVPARLREHSPEGLEAWLGTKMRLSSGATADRLAEALKAALAPAGSAQANDDLTAVVIRFEQAATMEGAA